MFMTSFVLLAGLIGYISSQDTTVDPGTTQFTGFVWPTTTAAGAAPMDAATTEATTTVADTTTAAAADVTTQFTGFVWPTTTPGPVTTTTTAKPGKPITTKRPTTTTTKRPTTTTTKRPTTPTTKTPTNCGDCIQNVCIRSPFNPKYNAHKTDCDKFCYNYVGRNTCTPYRTQYARTWNSTYWGWVNRSYNTLNYPTMSVDLGFKSCYDFAT